MYHIQNLKRSSFLRWVFINLSSKPICPNGSLHNTQNPNPRFHSTKNPQKLNQFLTDNGYVAFREAQDALLDYLHSTRSLQFMDAENISRNSPRFLGKLLKGVENKEGGVMGQTVARFLRYHPINEFEPFFESMGLDPCEFSTLLPRNLMFLSDDNVLLENYHVFCQYGFAPNKIGKIYKEVEQVFRFRDGVLLARLHDLQNMVLDQSAVIKLVGSCPSILIGGEMHDFVVKVVTELKTYGIVNGWFIKHLSEEDSYNWKHILELLCLFKRLGFENEQLGRLLRKHPTVLLQDSGTTSASIIGFLLKFGADKNEIRSLFLHFPELKVHEFVSNLRRSYYFLSEIEMDVRSIGKLVCKHPHLLGSCPLKGVKTALNCLNSGKKRLCRMIENDPQEIKNLALGLKVEPLPSEKNGTLAKIKFLIEMGFAENSSDMKRALKRFRGRAEDLQQRFECLVNIGFDRIEVAEMLKTSPQVVNQTTEVLEMKIDFIVNDLGYPLSSISTYPSSLSYAIEKVKLRCMMYEWLREEGKTNRLALSTILACSEKKFIRDLVNRHPNGIDVYRHLKRQVYPVV